MSDNQKAKKTRMLNVPDPDNSEIQDIIKKMKAITPSLVSSQLDIKVSVAKLLLNYLQENGKIELVAKSQNIKVFNWLD